jgi:hypothetical protein
MRGRPIRRDSENLGRALHALGRVWRRPRLVVGSKYPQHQAEIEWIGQMITRLPPNEVAVFADEAQIDLNPKNGAAWMLWDGSPRSPRPAATSSGIRRRRW